MTENKIEQKVAFELSEDQNEKVHRFIKDLCAENGTPLDEGEISKFNLNNNWRAYTQLEVTVIKENRPKLIEAKDVEDQEAI